MSTELNELMQKPTLTVAQTVRLLGIGRDTIYSQVKSGEIESVKVGRRLLVLTGPLRRKLKIEPTV